MKALILAAGRGSRLNKYTFELPKCMLNFKNKSLLERQLDRLKNIQVEKIIVVTGYKSETINFEGLTYYYNENYATTNMLESLMCAATEFNDDFLICYSDIIYSKKLLKTISEANADFNVAVDSNWKEYWKIRYGTTNFDLETLFVDSQNNIKEIGKSTSSSEGLNFRYIGMLKFSKKAMRKIVQLYDEKKKVNENWIQSGNCFKQGYFTDLLHELILFGETIKAVPFNRGWLEFDTNEDYEIYSELVSKNVEWESDVL